MTRRFVMESSALNLLQKSLTHIGTSPDGWTQLYVDTATAQRWEERRLYPEQHGGGVPYFVSLPEPTPAELVDLALKSAQSDESLVAATLLADQPEQWDSFLTELERRSGAPKALHQIRSLIDASGIALGANRASTTGKSLEEIQGDHDRYLAFARRANQLLACPPESPA